MCLLLICAGLSGCRAAACHHTHLPPPVLSCWTFLQLPTHTTTSHPQMSLFSFCCPAPQPATAIRQYLCLSLLKNSASSIPAALQLSASIFLSLLQKFRSALKAEVGVFFPMVMLKVGCGALGSKLFDQDLTGLLFVGWVKCLSSICICRLTPFAQGSVGAFVFPVAEDGRAAPAPPPARQACGSGCRRYPSPDPHPV